MCVCVCRYNTEQYSPYAAPSPQGSYQPSPSPQSYHQVAPSPVGYQNTHSPASYHPTPSPMAYQASPSPSPVGYSPMTPGAPSPGGYNPHTPGSNIEQGGSDWVTPDILVRVKDSFMDLMGQTGAIRSVTVNAGVVLAIRGGGFRGCPPESIQKNSDLSSEVTGGVALLIPPPQQDAVRCVSR